MVAYSGRNEWPHCEMQWASSTAIRATPTRASAPHELLGPESLGADVEQLVVAPLGAAQHIAPLGLAHAAVDGRHLGDPPGSQVLHLIVHERHQRSDHQRDPRRQQGRDLEGDRLARPGGQNGQEVRPLHEAPHGVELARSPAPEPEEWPEFFEAGGNDLGAAGGGCAQLQPGQTGPGVGALDGPQPLEHGVVEFDVSEVFGNVAVCVLGPVGPGLAGWTRQRAQNEVAVGHGTAHAAVEHDGDAEVGLRADQPSGALCEAQGGPRRQIMGIRVLAPVLHGLHAGADYGVGRRVERDLLDDQQAERRAGDVDSLPERPQQRSDS